MTKIICPACAAENLSNSKYCSGCGKALPAASAEIETSHIQPSSAKKKPFDKAKIVGTITGIVVFTLTSYGVRKLMFSPPSYDKQLVMAANEINKVCPIMVDASTQLNNAIALPGNAFQYNYTIIDIEKAEVNLDTVKKYLEPGIISNVKNSAEMKIQREHKTTIIYNYKDKNGVDIYKLTVTPDMYK
ncbi:MAG: hypothetical protein K9G49_07380 [Taibaiella sp.]|nr:hypothetical protein [Taibaiella sp.]